ncbi:MAG: flippase-like domain-containing protein [Chlorobiota bacterium]|nr:flippase-like domain-containing protein [Chlorobiota bacterium]QQS67335.1 MAG: flippase-like domain-containing protein [Chlorobiota bacterium]
MLKKSIYIILISIVVIIGLWFSFKGVEWSQIFKSLKDVKIWFVVLQAFSMLIAHLIRAERWRLMISESNQIKSTFTFTYTIIGYAMSNLIPRSGEAIRPLLLSKKINRPFTQIAATVIVERLLDGIVLLVLITFLIYSAKDKLSVLFYGKNEIELLLIILIPLIVVLFFIWLIIKTKIGDLIVGKIYLINIKIGEFGKRILHDIRLGFKFDNGTKYVKIIFYSIIMWIFYGLVFYFGFYAFDFKNMYFSDMFVMLGATLIAVTIAPTPGGAGLFHYACISVLTKLYNIDNNIAVAFTLITHFIPYIFITVVGLILMIKEGVKFKFNSE